MGFLELGIKKIWGTVCWVSKGLGCSNYWVSEGFGVHFIGYQKALGFNLLGIIMGGINMFREQSGGEHSCNTHKQSLAQLSDIIACEMQAY